MSTHCTRLRVCGCELASRDANCEDANLHVPEPIEVVTAADGLAAAVERYIGRGLGGTLNDVRAALSKYRLVSR